MRNLIKVYFGPYRRSVLLIIVLLIFQVFLQISIINSIKPIIARGINNIDTHLIISYGTLMLVLLALYSITTVTVSRKAARISAESVKRIREDMFKKILSFKRPRDSGASMSGLMNRLVGDVNNIQEFITEFLCMGLYVPLLAIAVIISTAATDPVLCAALALSFVSMTLVIFHLGRKEIQVRSRMMRVLDRTIHLFRELLVGARTARSFDISDAQFETFSENNGEYSKLNTDATLKVSIFSSFSTLFLIIIIVAVYLLVILNKDDIVFSSSNMVLFIQYLVLFISCASITPFIVTTVPQVKSSFGRISKVMNGESEVPGDDVPTDFDGPLVSGSNGLTIIAGSETSIIGRTGSGKSEMIRSILRLDDVEPGEFMFKGRDITELDPRSLRESIAYAGDLALAFKGTVSDNVGVWRDITDERIKEAMVAAKVDLDFDMMLDKFGSNVSMGQIQKISIARALASDAELYIFDDCFTELDPKSENEIVSNIRGMLKGRTVIFLSHQFRISPGSDRVSMMENGRIIDSGTHDDLIERCDIYRRMYLTGGGIVE